MFQSTGDRCRATLETLFGQVLSDGKGVVWWRPSWVPVTGSYPNIHARQSSLLTLSPSLMASPPAAVRRPTRPPPPRMLIQPVVGDCTACIARPTSIAGICPKPGEKGLRLASPNGGTSSATAASQRTTPGIGAQRFGAGKGGYAYGGVNERGRHPALSGLIWAMAAPSSSHTGSSPR